MKNINSKNFGIIIAFLLPGFIFLWGLSYSFDAVAIWFAKSGEGNSQSVGSFLYVTLASLALGLLISAVRWLLIDHLHGWTCVSDPGINFANLKEKDRYAAFLGAVENHYRYYQYYSNTLVAVIGAFIFHVIFASGKPSATVYVAVFVVVVALFLGSRDALKKYYARAYAILK